MVLQKEGTPFTLTRPKRTILSINDSRSVLTITTCSGANMLIPHWRSEISESGLWIFVDMDPWSFFWVWNFENLYLLEMAIDSVCVGVVK